MAFDIIIIPLLQLLLSLINIFKMSIVVYIIINLLLSFNIVNKGSIIIYNIQSVLAQLIEPTLSPIRRILPRTGMFDFSPVILILLLQFLIRVITLTIMKHFNG